MEKHFEKLISALGDDIADGFFSKGKINFEKIREIRLTVNSPIMIVTDEERFFINEKPVSGERINKSFFALCEYSVHTYKNEICDGFITCDGGIRVGICGTAVYSDKKIHTVKDISALNIRIPHEIKGICEKVEPFFGKGGMLIIGPPCSGKTTLLRDITRAASKNFFVTVVDERMEIAGIYSGKPSFDIGTAMVLNGFKKSDGIKSAVRSMSPEIIVCDEFGDEDDISSAMFAMKSGSQIVASIHSADKNDFIKKPFVKKLLETEIFSFFIFINKNHEIYEIVTEKELFL